MKARKPTLKHKKLMNARGLDPTCWLVEYEDNVRIRFIHREHGFAKTILKETANV